MVEANPKMQEVEILPECELLEELGELELENSEGKPAPAEEVKVPKKAVVKKRITKRRKKKSGSRSKKNKEEFSS
jgi:hypothetical protein